MTTTTHCAICAAHDITTPAAHDITVDPDRDGIDATTAYACDECHGQSSKVSATYAITATIQRDHTIIDVGTYETLGAAVSKTWSDREDAQDAADDLEALADDLGLSHITYTVEEVS